MWLREKNEEEILDSSKSGNPRERPMCWLTLKIMHNMQKQSHFSYFYYCILLWFTANQNSFVGKCVQHTHTLCHSHKHTHTHLVLAVTPLCTLFSFYQEVSKATHSRPTLMSDDYLSNYTYSIITGHYIHNYCRSLQIQVAYFDSKEFRLEPGAWYPKEEPQTVSSAPTAPWWDRHVRSHRAPRLGHFFSCGLKTLICPPDLQWSPNL